MMEIGTVFHRMRSYLLPLVAVSALAGSPASVLAQETPPAAPEGQAAPPAGVAAPAAAPQQGGAAAQSAVPEPEWVKLCSENPQNKQNICVVTRERRASTGQLLAAVSIREMGDKRMLVTAVPPGMLLRPGMQVQIDNSKPTKVAYSICFPNLCFGEAEINGDYVTAMKRGTRLILTTLNQQAKPINFDVSLAGFTASYDGVALDPRKLQEQQKKLQDALRERAGKIRQELIEKQKQQTSTTQ